MSAKINYPTVTMNREQAARILEERGVGIFSKMNEERIPAPGLGAIVLFELQIQPHSAVRFLSVRDPDPDYIDDGKTAVAWFQDDGSNSVCAHSHLCSDKNLSPPTIALQIAFGPETEDHWLKHRLLHAESTVLNALYNNARVRHRGPWVLTDDQYEDGTMVARLVVAGIRESIPKEVVNKENPA